MNDVYENIYLYNPNRQRKKLTVFYDMIADFMTNNKFQSIIKELFIRCRKINISLEYLSLILLCIHLNIYHSVLFFCTKRYKIKFNTLFYYKDQ